MSCTKQRSKTVGRHNANKCMHEISCEQIYNWAVEFRPFVSIFNIYPYVSSYINGAFA